MRITHPRQSTPSKRLRRGFSLIEVLVAVLVLSLGLLGLAGLQMASMKFNHSAHQRTDAVTLASDIFDCIRSNKVAASSYVISASATPTAGTVAGDDLTNWRTRITMALGASATGAVASDAEGKYTVTITWKDASSDSNNQNYQLGRADQSFTFIGQP